ncbi:hypothetical protein FGM00_15055 [Aggregatimonas sangjinii]|uniref:T9SS type A sorting domain-containing protein n=1 Tax=Aggregatimonas sangjinii TaxID=2583587 RepID=A0A5B7SW13_9FLAO|nr:DUF5722 domain-containing protein [Aggregatimonas sangjinii]QCX01363.1 hypothetical protein FGM00_15055 [Aggregatimonas sangjinii]
MKTKLPSSLFLLVFVLLFGLNSNAQNLTLELNPSLKNQLAVTENPTGTYELATQGADPWIQTRPIPDFDPDAVYVISFDYIAEEGLDNFQIFYGAPVNPARRVDFGPLVASSTYRTFKAFMKYEAPTWDSAYERIRFDFGKTPGQNLTVRNVQLRAAAPGEVIPLNLDGNAVNQLTLSSQLPDGSYDVATLGNDPWVASEEITTTYDPNKTFVVSFDYTSQSGLDDLQIFFGTPFSGARRAQLGSLPAASTPTNFSAIMSISAPNWSDATYDILRFDLGRLPNLDINLNNLVLREATNAEQLALEVKETVAFELDVNATSPFLVGTELPDGSYELNTSENDPWIRSKPISAIYDIDDTYILEFEYRSEEPYNELEVFYGPPITGAQKLVAGEIPPATDWTKFTINPRLIVDNFQDTERTVFRFDFGKNEGEEKTIFVRNFTLRKPTAQELTDEQTSDKFVSRAINQEFLNYLSTNFTDSITKVQVDLDSVRISGTINNGSDGLFLAEIEPHLYGFDQNEFDVVVPLTIKDGSFSVNLERFQARSDHNYDRLYSRWAVVSKTGDTTYEYTSNATWASDISRISENNIAEDKAETIKGLDGLTPSTLSNFQDLEDLDIKSMKINLLLNGVFSLNPSDLTHEFNGKTYNINTGFVNNLDTRLKRLSDSDIKAAFVLLIPINITNEDVNRIFVHPDASLGLYSMANVTSAEGVEYYAAMVDFLSERYSRPDKLYGRLDQWIIHNEVDAHTAWTHAGQKPVELYTEIYNRSLRTVHYTIRKHNPTAKVFTSFTKHFNSKPVSAVNFKSKDILNVLVDLSKKEGDFEWGIGWHSYPVNLFNPNVWNDPPAKTQFNFNTPEITPKNLEMIDAYVRQKDLLYNGKKVRTILLSENGFSSNPEKSPNANETTQAAALAYFWKKTDQRLPSIENIQLHRWVDNPNEAGLLFGLWTVEEGTFDGFDQKKEGWFVWNAAGTPEEDAVFEPYKSVIGISEWSEIYNDVPTETTPFTVQMNIANCGADLQDLLVSFNGELKFPQEDGSLSFYNVASNVPQPYTISKNGTILASDVLSVSENLEIIIDLQAIEAISAKGISPTEVEITWESSLSESSGFVLEFKTEDGDFAELARLSSNETSYIHSGVTSGEGYTYRVAALLEEDSFSCYSEEVAVIAPFLIVDYQDGDKYKLDNSDIKPQLLLRNESDSEIDLNRASVRYWFTAEDFNPLNFYIDYAQLGNENIAGEFTALTDARDGANYYVTYSFAEGTSVAAFGNSGVIKSRISKSDFSDFNESDDYSYADFTKLMETNTITVYWDGNLIWGEEPEVSENQEPQLRVLHRNRDNVTNNRIKPELQLINVGNRGVTLEDVTMRYWFTPENTAALNSRIDYAQLGKDNTIGSFATAANGSEQYFEVGFTADAGDLYAFSGTGDIKTQIFKQDWSSFDESDDYSFKEIGNRFDETTTITAYINGELVWGVEPNGNSAGSTIASKGELLYPNPANTFATILWGTTVSNIDTFVLVDYMSVSHEVNTTVRGREVTVNLATISEGLYILKGMVNGEEISHRIMVRK